MTRRAATVVVAVLGMVSNLAGQRAHQLELGGSVSVTRYDHLMDLPNHIGILAHAGYFLSDRIGLEAAGGFSQPQTPIPFQFTTVRWASASFVLNFPLGVRNLPYLLGGYTRIDYGSDVPYNFADHALHAALGDRLFLFPGAALRLEGRAIFAPQTDSRFGSRWAGHVIGSIGLTMFTGSGRWGRPAADRSRPGLADADGDLVSDRSDRCSNTPRGAQVDQNGCPIDGDRDGVPDGVDQCAATLAGVSVDAKGCPTDADTDGVADHVDRCPDTPRGVAVDASGCPLKDLDDDGVSDTADRCPNTLRGTQVDALGCPVLFGEGGATMLRGVSFEPTGVTLAAGSFVVLDGVAAALVAHPDWRVEIAVYTDDAGTAAVNLRRSQARADAVRTYLVGRGVGAARLVAHGLGSASPVASNTTAAGRAQNRRVELHQLP
jgi:outer membrane protein OmpA-like peptidoglycan-associated protein